MRTARGGVVTTGLVGLILLTGCSGDDADTDEPEESHAESTAEVEAAEAAETSSPSSATTEPQASDDPAAVRGPIEDLLGQWDVAMTEILADVAEVEADPGHPLRVELAEAFTSNSPYVTDLGLLLSGYTNQDVESITGGDRETTLVEFTIASDDDPDRVEFTFCTFSDAGAALSTGEDVPAEVSITHGAGEAHRADGVWLLHNLVRLGREQAPSGTENQCPAPADDEIER